MKHEVNWTKYITDCFIRYGKLSEEQILIMRLRCSNCSDIEIANKLNISVATYYRRIKELKKIYDKVRIENPELNLPKRELIRENSFDFYSKDNAIDMINHINFDTHKIEIKITKK